MALNGTGGGKHLRPVSQSVIACLDRPHSASGPSFPARCGDIPLMLDGLHHERGFCLNDAGRAGIVTGTPAIYLLLS
jgi:hypothetical protein